MRAAVMDVVIGGRDDAEVFARAKRAGFAGVEVVVSEGDLAARPSGRPRDACAGRRRPRGSRSPRSCWASTTTKAGSPIANPEASSRAQDDVRHAIAWARRARTRGHPRPLLHASGAGERRGRRSRGGRVSSALPGWPPSAASRSASKGRCLPSASRRSRPACGSDAFGCYFDLANPLAHKGLDVPTEIRALGELITARSRQGHARSDRRLPAGHRARRLRRNAHRALSEIGYDGWLTLETPPAPPPLVSRDLSFTRVGVLGARRRPPAGRVSARSRRSSARASGSGSATTFARLGLESVQLDGAAAGRVPRGRRPRRVGTSGPGGAWHRHPGARRLSEPARA